MHNASTAFMLSATVLGFLLGSALPARVTQLLNPMISTAVSANAAAAVLGSVTGAGYRASLRGFITKARPLRMPEGPVLTSQRGSPSC